MEPQPLEINRLLPKCLPNNNSSKNRNNNKQRNKNRKPQRQRPLNTTLRSIRVAVVRIRRPLSRNDRESLQTSGLSPWGSSSWCSNRGKNSSPRHNQNPRRNNHSQNLIRNLSHNLSHSLSLRRQPRRRRRSKLVEVGPHRVTSWIECFRSIQWILRRTTWKTVT